MAALLGGASSWAEDVFHDTPGAVQTIYRGGVPHTARDGALRLSYQAGESFFPIGVYNGMLDPGDGSDGFGLLARAGFNAAVPWGAQDFETVLASARDHGLQIVLRDPSDDTVKRFRGDPAILSYEVDHEPTMHAQEETALWRLEAFRERRAAIRALDPRRPVLTVDSPSITPPYRNAWLAYAEASDAITFWKYPFFKAPVRTMDTPRSVPEVTLLAAETGHERKPVWYVAQAFGRHGSDPRDWFMPGETQMRALLYAGLIHGATGVFWFTQDSYVSRDDHVIGAAPDPKPDYRGPERRRSKPPFQATAQELEQSRRMWNAVVRLNGELQRLTPAILSPTSARDYRIAIRGTSASPTPIRALLKDAPDGLILLAVNIDADPVEARFTFDADVNGLEPLFDSTPAPTVANGAWTERIEPWGVRVYRLR